MKNFQKLIKFLSQRMQILEKLRGKSFKQIAAEENQRNLDLILK